MIMSLMKPVYNDLIRFLALCIFILARDLSVFYNTGLRDLVCIAISPDP